MSEHATVLDSQIFSTVVIVIEPLNRLLSQLSSGLALQSVVYYGRYLPLILYVKQLQGIKKQLGNWKSTHNGPFVKNIEKTTSCAVQHLT